MRILAIDVGTGTQDILLFDSTLVIENCPKLVVPSATSIVAAKIAAATRRGDHILLTGDTMGGGPAVWAAEAHLRAGFDVYATPDAARTFDDHLENVTKSGVHLVSEDEAARLRDVTVIAMGDLALAAVDAALDAFGVEPAYDAVAVAVFDHGAAPIDVSDRTFRFEHLQHVLKNNDDLRAWGHWADETPPYLTRMLAVARSHVSRSSVPLLMLDTAPAGALGCLADGRVAGEEERLLVNLGNMHATAFRLRGTRVVGLFEHHTGLVDRAKVEVLLDRLMAGELTNAEVFDDHGHGGWIGEPAPPPAVLAVTGPRRSLLRGSRLGPHFAAPFGDMMLSGCFGLVRAVGYRRPDWRGEIEEVLAN